MAGRVMTLTVTALTVCTCPSFAASWNTYPPGIETPTVVDSAFGLPKVAVPGPLSWLQAISTAPGGLGLPSSAAVPLRLTEAGQTMVWLLPALDRKSVV